MPPNVQPNPKILNLVKSIGLAETGGDYNAQGKNGEIGAYQMTPDFIQANAPKYGIDTTNFDQSSQNKLAYSVVQDWAKQGLSPAQIASRWNSGNPDAYQDPDYQDTNSAGASYNVPNYVNKVQDNYEKFSGQSSQNQTQGQPQQPQQSPIMKFLTDTSVPIGNMRIAGPGAITAGLLAGGISLLSGDNGLFGKIKSLAPEAGTAIGGALGGTPGALVGESIGQKIAGNGQPQPQTPVQPQQSQSSTDLSALFAQSPQESNASKAIAQSLIQSLTGTIGGRKGLSDPSFQGGIESASLYGHAPTMDANGNMDFSIAEQKREATLAQLAQGEEKILAADKNRASMNEAIQFANEQVNENKLLTPIEKQEVIKNITEEANSYLPRSKGVESAGGISFGLDELAQARRQQYAATKGKYGVGKTTAKIEAHKALGHGLKRTIQNHTSNRELYDAILKEESKLINEKRVFKLLHGKKAAKTTGIGEFLHRKGGHLFATYLGDKIGGVLGAVVTNVLLTGAQKAADKRFGKNVFDSPQFQAALKIVSEKEPRAYKFFVDEIRKAGVVPPELKKEGVLIKVLNAEQKKYKKTKKIEPKEKTSKILEKGLVRPLTKGR